jgi:membrane-anchored mycosin MYCP
VNAAGAAVQAESGDHVAVSAPGADLVSTSAGAAGRLGMMWPVQDPSFAAAYVAGTVALLRSYRPSLTPDEITNRLTRTASRAPGGSPDGRLGWGVLDAYAAVSSELPADAPGPGARPVVGQVRSVLPAYAPAGSSTPYWWAGIVALLGVLLAAAVLIGAVTVRRGRAAAGGWGVRASSGSGPARPAWVVPG